MAERARESSDAARVKNGDAVPTPRAWIIFALSAGRELARVERRGEALSTAARRRGMCGR